jgi:hypothetical protein
MVRINSIMNGMKQTLGRVRIGLNLGLVLGWSLNLSLTAGTLAADKTVLYANAFEKAELDQVPDDFLVLDGGFAVKEEGGNRFLELPGAPLDSYGVMFGPNEKEGVAVSARIFGTNKGRRFPAFSVGLCGVGGYRLQVSPAKRLLEIYHGDKAVASKDYTWKPGTWTHLNLQVRKANETEWLVEGKAWKEGGAEPREWMISLAEKTPPYAGPASVWGKPFSGTPIRFDDLQVTTALTSP